MSKRHCIHDHGLRLPRRDFLKSTMTVAAAGAVGGGFGIKSAMGDASDAATASDWRTTDRHDDDGGAPHIAAGRPIVLRGGIVISVDPAVGNFAKADLLIRGKKIVDLRPNLGRVAGAYEIDATDMILIPGFTDPHRHSWEGQLRGINPNAVTITDYNKYTHVGFGPYYRPHDMYVGNLNTMLGCIDAGITCVIDNSHNSRTQAHSEAAIQALFDSGIRAVHASGAPQSGTWDQLWPNYLPVLQKKYFSSDDQLVTLRMFSGANVANWQFARSLGLWTHSEGAGGATLATLASMGLLDHRHAFNHMGNTSDLNWQLIRDSGSKVNIAATSDPQYALSEGIPALQAALDHGMRPGLGVDNETSYATDMFLQMRVAFFIQRGVRQNMIFKGLANPPAPVTVQDMLEFATLRNAENAALDHKTGTLTPGKEADIVLIRAADINTLPLCNAFDTVVQQANTKNVDTVFIAGKIMKWRGELLDVNVRKLRRLVEDSRQYLFDQAGFTLDIFATAP